MKRARFCQKLIIPGMACGCMPVMLSGFLPGNIHPKDATRNENETPCNEKMEFTQKWVKRFFDILDRDIDEKTRTALMRANGEACANGAYGEFTCSGGS